MKRGDIWAVKADRDYLQKPRPAVIVQVRQISETESVIVCLFTSEENSNLATRIMVEPSVENGLNTTSYIMVEKITALNRSEFGNFIGRLEEKYLSEIDSALKDLLGF